MCRIVEECVMEAEARMMVRMTEALAKKVESIENACKMLDAEPEDYWKAKEYLVEIRAI